MADPTSVATALAGLITTALYPNVDPPSVLGFPVKVYAGWPDPATLDTDLKPIGTDPRALHVSVYPLPGERNTTRYPANWSEGAKVTATYTLTAGSLTITVGGAPPDTYTPQNLAAFVNGNAYTTQATAGQAPAQIAAALQAKIVVDVAGTTVVGAVITLPSTARIGALRVGTSAPISKTVRMQEKQFQVSAWADTPANRSALCNAFDPVLADTPFLTLTDGSSCRLHYVGSRENDFDQKQGIYRRDFIYTVEFPTVRADTAAEIVVFTESLQDPNGVLIKSTTV